MIRPDELVNLPIDTIIFRSRINYPLVGIETKIIDGEEWIRYIKVYDKENIQSLKIVGKAVAYLNGTFPEGFSFENIIILKNLSDKNKLETFCVYVDPNNVYTDDPYDDLFHSLEEAKIEKPE